LEDREALVDLRARDDERGQEAEHALRRAVDEEPGLAAAVHDGRAGPLEDGAQHEPHATHLLDAVAPDERLEPAPEVLPNRPHVPEERRLGERLHRRDRRRARDRVAAEGRAVRAGREGRGDALGRAHGADREPAAERLGERHDVGRDAGVLVREETPRAPEPALDLVEDEEHLPPLGERPPPCCQPQRRASFIAASFASAPLFARKMRSANECRQRSAHSSPAGSVWSTLEAWSSVAACAVTASATAGWPWPRLFTARPA